MERKNLSIDYSFITKNEFVEDENLILCPKRYSHDYKSLISNIKKMSMQH